MVNAKQLLLANYIKYDRLFELSKVIPPPRNNNPIILDIYIDLYSMLYGLYGGAYEISLDEGVYDIAAGILNNIAHYRQFYRKYNVDTRFFLIYSNNWSVDKTKFVPEYNSDFQFRITTSCNFIYDKVLENLTIVEEVCKYINNTAFISSNVTDMSVLIYDTINKESINNTNNRYNIIISKDLVVNQLVGITPNTIVFKPMKHQNSDVSYYIAYDGLYQNFLNIYKSKYQLEDNIISPGLYSFILACTKVPQRGLKSLLSIPTAFKEIEDVIKLPDVLNGYNTNIQILYERMNPKTSMTLQHGNIDGRFKSIDTIYNYGYYVNSPEYKIFKGIYNLYDPDGLHKIDTEYFSKWHLNLENM